MSEAKINFSVTEAAALCGIKRGTVGYWIRTKKLQIRRTGKKYLIPAEELYFFFKASGKKTHPELADQASPGPCFRTLCHCWQCLQRDTDSMDCSNCLFFRNKIDACFTIKDSLCSNKPKACDQCSYYLENYLPRIQFIHQIDMPAAAYSQLSLWGANRFWAEMSGVPPGLAKKATCSISPG